MGCAVRKISLCVQRGDDQILELLWHWSLLDLAAAATDRRMKMSVWQQAVSRRSLTIAAAAAACVISLGLGANAALNNKLNQDQKTVSSIARTDSSRIALVIGNGRYPDANAPLAQPINDARALSSALRKDGFDVDVIENANKGEMQRAVERLKAKAQKGSVVMLFFGGYGVQADHQNYMIPVDAAIWKETDVKRDGVSIESVLADLKQNGASAKLVVLDASRRNPYERRFRTYSRGLSPINATGNTLVLSSATADKVADDSRGEHSVLVNELLSQLNNAAGDAENVFNRTRMSVSQNSGGAQVPTVSSSLVESVSFGQRAGS